MNLVKIVLSSLLFMTVVQAKPVITGTNIKIYLDAVKLSVVVDNKWIQFKFYAQGIAYPNGEVRLIYPKLVVDNNFYAIELDPKESQAASHVKAVTSISDKICSIMERKARRSSGALDTTAYINNFPSIRLNFKGSNGFLVHAGKLNTHQTMVINSIVCE